MTEQSSTESGLRLPTEPSVHDAVLAAIPLCLAVAVAVGLALSAAPSKALFAGSVPATGTIGYALFCNPPGDRAR
jgi:hypothetical protein